MERRYWAIDTINIKWAGRAEQPAELGAGRVEQPTEPHHTRVPGHVSNALVAKGNKNHLLTFMLKCKDNQH